jgi:hypothetical protein
MVPRTPSMLTMLMSWPDSPRSCSSNPASFIDKEPFTVQDATWFGPIPPHPPFSASLYGSQSLQVGSKPISENLPNFVNCFAQFSQTGCEVGKHCGFFMVGRSGGIENHRKKQEKKDIQERCCQKHQISKLSIAGEENKKCSQMSACAVAGKRTT